MTDEPKRPILPAKLKAAARRAGSDSSDAKLDALKARLSAGRPPRIASKAVASAPKPAVREPEAAPAPMAAAPAPTAVAPALTPAPTPAAPAPTAAALAPKVAAPVTPAAKPAPEPRPPAVPRRATLQGFPALKRIPVAMAAADGSGSMAVADITADLLIAPTSIRSTMRMKAQSFAAMLASDRTTGELLSHPWFTTDPADISSQLYVTSKPEPALAMTALVAVIASLELFVLLSTFG